MSLVVTIVSFVIVLSILVLAHELGHFLVGRWAGARIEEFAIGFPPRVWSRRRGETDYSINAIPLGGYVRFAGEDGPEVSGGLSSLPRIKRALVLVAGVSMNIILAVLIYALIFATGSPTLAPKDGVKLATINSGAPADQAGLKPGDIILQVNGQTVTTVDSFSAAVRSMAGQEMTFGIQRADGQAETVKLTPRADPPQGEGPMGVSIEQNGVSEIRRYPLLQSLQMGAQETWRITALTFSVPVMIVRGMLPVQDARPIGPLGIARYVGSTTQAIPTVGFWPILQLMAMLSVGLAIANILPLPGLDGGRLLFVIIEWLRRGKRLNPEREAVLHFAGLMFFMAIVVVITYFDIVSPAPSLNFVP